MNRGGEPWACVLGPEVRFEGSKVFCLLGPQ